MNDLLDLAIKGHGASAAGSRYGQVREQDIMSDTLTCQQIGTAARGQTHALFAQTMGYAAATAFACLIGMQFAVRRSVPLTVGPLGAFGLLTGLAVAPTVAYNGSMGPRALWKRLLTAASMTAAAAWGGETDG
jgi:modulator of FtsH protease